MIYRIVTYDKGTELMTGNFPIPPAFLEQVKSVAGFQPQDDGLGEYPLDEEQTQKIARILNFQPETSRLYYAVEPYDPPPEGE